jgi:hypothetical protein
MPFRNSVVGGTTLVRAAIRSPNYVAGVSGWSINRDGSAEFSDIVIRGSSGDAIIVGPSGGVQVIISTTGGVGMIRFPTGQPQEDISARIAAGVQNDGAANESITLGVNGPRSSTNDVRMRMTLQTPAENGTFEGSVNFLREEAGVDTFVAILNREVTSGCDRLINNGRLEVRPNDDSPNSAVYVNVPASYTGQWLRIQKDGIDRLHYDTNGYFQLERALAADDVLGIGVEGDSFNRLNIEADGTIGWGPGSAATDVALSRSGVGEMTLTGQITSYDGDAFTTYTPAVTNGGAVTWTTRTGRWQRVGKMIYFNAYLNVNVAGSGAGLITIDGPVDISRTTRQVVMVHLDNVTAAREGTGVVLAFDSGSGPVFDRVRGRDNVNLTGADLLAGAHITVEGWYREA